MAAVREIEDNRGPMTLENTFVLPTHERLRLYRLGQILQDFQTPEEATLSEALKYVGTLARKDIAVRAAGTDAVEFQVSEDTWLRMRGFNGEAARDNVRARQRDGIRPLHESTVTSVVELEMVGEQATERRGGSTEAVRKGVSIMTTTDTGLVMVPLIQRSLFPSHREYAQPLVAFPTSLPGDFKALLPDVARAIGSAATTIRRPVVV